MYIYIISILLVVIIYEIIHGCIRYNNRSKYYNLALTQSKKTNKPLLVIGNPSSGPSNKVFGANYGCGTMCIDIKGCTNCPNQEAIDIYNYLKKQPANSMTIFISYVLEYVSNIDETIKEIYRVAGSIDNIFIIHAHPWCITSHIANSSPGDAKAVNIITGAPPVKKEITYSKL